MRKRTKREERKDIKLGRIQYKLDYDFQQSQVIYIVIILQRIQILIAVSSHRITSRRITWFRYEWYIGSVR